MKARWALLLMVGGLCAWGRADVVLEEHSGYYSYPDDWNFQWLQMDPNDPNSFAPDITIKIVDAVHPYWFEATDSVTGEPADIYAITANPYIGNVPIKVVAKDGVSPGAHNVGKLVFDVPEVTSMLQGLNISGTLGTLGEGSYVQMVMNAPFSVADVAAPLEVESISGTALVVTGAGPHYGDITVKSVFASPAVGDEISIAGDYLGTMTLGIVD